MSWFFLFFGVVIVISFFIFGFILCSFLIRFVEVFVVDFGFEFCRCFIVFYYTFLFLDWEGVYLDGFIVRIILDFFVVFCYSENYCIYFLIKLEIDFFGFFSLLCVLVVSNLLECEVYGIFFFWYSG